MNILASLIPPTSGQGNPPEGFELSLRAIAMPGDANPAGDIFGGWVMSQMDLAAYVRSCELARGRTVTAAVKEMSFAKPVNIGDTVCVYTSIIGHGRSSVTLAVEVWTRRAMTGDREKVTDGQFIMVAVDESGKPKPAFAEL